MQTGSLWGAVPTLDGLGLLTYGGRGAKLWRLKDDAEVMSYRPSTAIRIIRYAPDGQLLAAGSQNGTIILWNPAESASQRKLVGGHVQAINGLAFSPDGSQLVSSAADGRVVVWDVKQGTILLKRRITERNVRGTDSPSDRIRE